jgi:hypothetical protein
MAKAEKSQAVLLQALPPELLIIIFNHLDNPERLAFG